MRWTPVLLTALVVCALLGGAAGCGADDAHERGTAISASPVGTLLDETDEEGRLYREVDGKGAPEVAIEIQPDPAGGWDVRLTVRAFRFSPAGTPTVPVAGRGIAHLYVDGRTVARLRTAEHHLAGHLVPRGTHHVTARLYADDGTVWAVHGKPVESTADITASESAPAPAAPRAAPAEARRAVTARGRPPEMSGHGTETRTDGGGSPDPGGKAS
ncbi:hypothetical protein CW362_32945 [Streptomyces populi]|uniref:Nuclear transport factor 2 family protein n=1 Tax=Streptomyces populi TaxID=2058924 RepID=A0A2I0SFX2_9ACTN|nr:hypothetical protein [Streptomyces populi]PKT68838.1 hypothetical protein CW362_32945 [Streptomyces populi]